jgi:hypothetical protein
MLRRRLYEELELWVLQRERSTQAQVNIVQRASLPGLGAALPHVSNKTSALDSVALPVLVPRIDAPLVHDPFSALSSSLFSHVPSSFQRKWDQLKGSDPTTSRSIHKTNLC